MKSKYDRISVRFCKELSQSAQRGVPADNAYNWLIILIGEPDYYDQIDEFVKKLEAKDYIRVDKENGRIHIREKGIAFVKRNESPLYRFFRKFWPF